MDTNYRNTAEILGYAASLISGDEFADIEGLLESGDAVSVLRAGAAPLFTRFTSRPAHDAALVAHIQSLGTPLGDIAVLAVDKYALASIALSLSSAGIPFIELTEYDGTPVNAVKVGTVKRAKGLEFKQVLLAQVRDSLMMGEVPTEGAALERYELNRRELYVAMTRARDGLWVGSLQ
jgi:superfamily I DNA/RNA helicase